MAEERQHISGETGHVYFHMMLNMADDDLDQPEYRLLGHYLRWAGHGGSYEEGIRQTAKVCHMGKSTVIKTQERLAEKGYLRIVKPTKEQQKDGQPTRIIVLDRWAENVARYAKPVPEQNHPVPNEVQVMRLTCTQPGTPPVPNEVHKEEQREEPIKEEQSASNDATAIAALIKAWHDDAKVIEAGNPYQKTGYRKTAQAMHEAGITPADVTAFMNARRADTFWRDKGIAIGNVAKDIAAWKANRQPARSQLPEHRIVTPEELEIMAGQRQPHELTPNERVNNDIRDLANILRAPGSKTA